MGAVHLVPGGLDAGQARVRVELRGRLEIAPIEDEAGGARVAKESHVLITEGWARQSDHQSFADEVFEVAHIAILRGPGPPARRVKRATLCRGRDTETCTDASPVPYLRTNACESLLQSLA